ncbi:hypothetical protein AALO_G00202490 [Alosa alosa]|uniref:Uncharacterized protein n=1 Tax=Alosa alosa TaxID=278164 RepID=A0AAV6G7E1_9TELE|nr:hypothetical protein AALO_G00202490 [Alosa alosa]
MEVRGELRGERGCFMKAMRAIFNTIRNRLTPKRARQRTTEDRRNLKKQSFGLNTRLTKRKHSANVRTANMDTAERRVQEDELKERLKYSLQTFRVRRKPHWVLQRGWGQNNMDELNMNDTQAGEDLQPAEPANENANNIDLKLYWA